MKSSLEALVAHLADHLSASDLRRVSERMAEEADTTEELDALDDDDAVTNGRE